MGKNINAAQLLLESYGKDSLSYFALHEKKQFFFSSTGQSFLAYTIEGKIALVSGDPIGPVEDIPILLKEFSYFVKGFHLTSCFLAVNNETLKDLLKLGHTHLHIGKEAIITLKMFEKSLLKKKVRRAERHVLNQGITFRMYKRDGIPSSYLFQLSIIAEEWLQEKGRREKGLTMSLGRIPTELDPDCAIALALHNEVVVGYLIFVPIYAVNGVSLDTSRKRKNVPNGLTEFLLIQSLEYFKQHGIKIVSLNFATFHYPLEDGDSLSHKYFLSIVYKFLSRIYKTDTLFTFNKKFLPNWQVRYIAFERKRYLPHYLFAIAKTEL